MASANVGYPVYISILLKTPGILYTRDPRDSAKYPRYIYTIYTIYMVYTG